MNITKVLSTEIDSLSRRVVKFLRLGKSDVQTALEAGPYGIDSNPVKDMIAVYSPTTQNGKSVIVGYINKNQLAEVGELRLFSTNAAGAEQSYIWLKNNGNIELGGDADNAIRYAALNTQLQSMITSLNSQLTLIATGIVAGGGSYTPTPLTLDISSAKINNIKTP